MAIKIPQVRQTGLPSTTGVRTPGADAFGASIGAANEKLGKFGVEVGVELQERENETKTREVDTFYTQRLNDLRNGYAQKNGQDAYTSQQDYDQAVNDLRDEAMGMLDNHAQRDMWAPLADRKATIAIDFGSQHALKSFKDWEVKELTAQGAMHQNDAMLKYGTPEGAAAMGALMENIEDLGERQGWSPDVIKAEKDKSVSAITTGKIDQLIADEDPMAAKQLLASAKEKGLILAADLPRIEKKVDAYADKYTQMTMADIILAENAGDPTAMWAATKTIVDPDHRKVVQAIVKQEITMQEALETKSRREAQRAIIDRLHSMDNPSIRDLPPKETMDPEVYASALQYIQNGNKVRPNELLINELLLEAKQNPEAFAKRELEKYSHEIPAGQLSAMLKAQDEIDQTGSVGTPPKPIEEAVTTAQLVKSASQLAGVDADDPEEAESFATNLRLRLEEAKQAKGSKLTFKEQESVKQEFLYEYELEKWRERSDLTKWWNWDDPEDNPLYFQVQGTDAQWQERIVNEAIKDVKSDGTRLTRESIKAKLQEYADKYSKD